MKATEFDEKFAAGEDLTKVLDISQAKRINQVQKRVRVNADPAGRILLRDIWPIENVDDYKIHFARWNSEIEPLDEWVQDRAAWQGWQKYYPNKNDFNRTFIFSLMKFYHEEDTWLFGGIFRVIALHEDQNCTNGHYYEVELTPALKAFIGRLKLHYSYRAKATRVNLKNRYNDFEVAEILREPYSGHSFPGKEVLLGRGEDGLNRN